MPVFFASVLVVAGCAVGRGDLESRGQALADALGRGDRAGACASHTCYGFGECTCEDALRSLEARVPYFVGAKLEGISHTVSGHNDVATLCAEAKGPRGAGRVEVYLINLRGHGGWRVQAVREQTAPCPTP